MNNTVNKLILDRGSCEKLHKKLRFADPVFITSGIITLAMIEAYRKDILLKVQITIIFKFIFLFELALFFFFSQPSMSIAKWHSCLSWLLPR